MRITAGVETQHVVMSSNEVNPLALYVMKPSMQGSRLEVVIEDCSTNSSQGLCRNVEVEIYLGWFLRSLIGCFMAGAGTGTVTNGDNPFLSLSQKNFSFIYS